MRRIGTVVLFLTFMTIACQSTRTAVPTAPQPAPVSESTATPTVDATAADTFTPTSTVAPEGTIFVDTLEQEIHPFLENGKCSLGEAIFAANSGEPKDSCAAGVTTGTVIELMPGEYHFTQRDQSPPQVEWIISVGSG